MTSRYTVNTNRCLLLLLILLVSHTVSRLHYLHHTFYKTLVDGWILLCIEIEKELTAGLY